MSFHTSARQLLWVPFLIFGTLTAAIAVGPAIAQKRGSDAIPTPPQDEDIARGRALFIREGCSYCHTQQVRVDSRMPADSTGLVPPIPEDARYGPASIAEDYATQSPPLLGTERTGPDLANVGDRIPNEAWHLVHLFHPRSLVPASVMPGYPWYFHSRSNRVQGEDKPITLPEGTAGSDHEIFATPDAQRLVKYLMSLKKPAKAP